MWSYQVKSQEFKLALEKFLEKHEHNKIIVLSQVPKLNGDVFRVERFKALGLPVEIGRDKRYRVANKYISTVSENLHNVSFLRLDDLPVFSGAPFYRGDLIYKDESHLNEVGAKVYAISALTRILKSLKK